MATGRVNIGGGDYNVGDYITGDCITKLENEFDTIWEYASNLNSSVNGGVTVDAYGNAYFSANDAGTKIYKLDKDGNFISSITINSLNGRLNVIKADRVNDKLFYAYGTTVTVTDLNFNQITTIALPGNINYAKRNSIQIDYDNNKIIFFTSDRQMAVYDLNTYASLLVLDLNTIFGNYVVDSIFDTDINTASQHVYLGFYDYSGGDYKPYVGGVDYANGTLVFKRYLGGTRGNVGIGVGYNKNINKLIVGFQTDDKTAQLDEIDASTGSILATNNIGYWNSSYGGEIDFIIGYDDGFYMHSRHSSTLLGAPGKCGFKVNSDLTVVTTGRVYFPYLYALAEIYGHYIYDIKQNGHSTDPVVGKFSLEDYYKIIK